MGNVLVQSIIGKVSVLLVDEGLIRWGNTELLGWYNEAQKDIIKPDHRPQANNKLVPVALQPGAVQVLPTQYSQINGVGRNMGADGNTPGKIPSKASREVIDTAFPDWQLGEPDVTVDTLIISPDTPRLFYTHPPQTNPAGHLEIYATAYPLTIEKTALDDAVLELDDIYETAVIAYMLYRACDKDADEPSMAQKSANYYMKYLGELGIVPTPTNRRTNIQTEGA